jgi:CPA1 family monovalent cation:H+ antiporter
VGAFADDSARWITEPGEYAWSSDDSGHSVMREDLKAVLWILAVGAAVAVGARRAGIAYNVPLVLVGLGLVFLKILPATPLDPEVVLVGFLPVLIFEGALNAELDHLRTAARPILFLALPGVFLSLVATAGVASFAVGLPFVVALLLGALLAITDTVSVLVAFRSVRVPHRLAAIMEGESLFNDGTALVLVSVTTTMVATGQADAPAAVGALVVAIVGGIAFGLAFGAVGSFFLDKTPDHLTATFATVVLVFATAVTAEEVHASPIIAIVVLGLMIGRAARRRLPPSRVLSLEGFWETAGFSLNVVIFLLVGMQLEPRSLLAEAPAIALALIALHVGRAAAVYGGFGALKLVTTRGGEAAMRRWGRDSVPLSWQHVMVAGNIKGSLSMAAVIALPQDLPYRGRLVAIVFGVTLVTLLTQALPFKQLLRFFGAVDRRAVDDELENARAALLEARRGQSTLDELMGAGLLSRREHAERKAAFQSQVVRAEASLKRLEAATEREAYVAKSLLFARRAALTDASRRGVLAPEVAEERVAALDDELMRLQRREELGPEPPVGEEGESTP